MSRLEARLGVQLLQRSTRRVQLTAEGTQLYERGKRVLADLDEIEAAVAARSAPRGVVRISASTSTGQRLLVPLVPRLLEAHPGLRLDLNFTDQVVDLAEAGIDIAIRWGELPPSDMVARLLGRTRQVIVGAPDYLKRRGLPRHPDDLRRHVRLGWNYQRAIPHWPFDVEGQRVAVGIGETVRVNDGDVMRQLALQGVGLARLSLYHAWDDLAAGRLAVVLEAFNTGVLEPIHAVYLGKPDRLPPRTRAVLDFLQANVDLRYAEQWRAPRGKRS
jgi:DNA-binding transcriptional LysR family regulator